MIIKTNATLLAAAASIAAVNDVRYYLNGVCIEPAPQGGVLLIGCNGHALVCIHDADGYADDTYIVKPPKRAKLGKKTAPEVEINDRGAHFADGVTVPAERIIGRFPDWRAIVPEKASDEPAAFNGDYVQDFARISLSFGSKHPFCMVRANGGGAALIQFDASVPAFGVLMPVRMDARDTATLPIQINDTPATLLKRFESLRQMIASRRYGLSFERPEHRATRMAELRRYARQWLDLRAKLLATCPELLLPASKLPADIVPADPVPSVPAEPFDDADDAEPVEPELDSPPVPAKATGSSTLRFYWNGIKDAKGAKLQPASYSRGAVRGCDEDTISIYGKHYRSFSAAINAQFVVCNNSDTMTDYFCDDTIRVTPAHPLYRQVLAAFEAQEAHRNKRYAKNEARRAERRDVMAPAVTAVPERAASPVPVPPAADMPPVPADPEPAPRPMASVHVLPVRTHGAATAQNAAYAAENCGIYRRVAAVEFAVLHLPRQGFPYHAANSPTRPS